MIAEKKSCHSYIEPRALAQEPETILTDLTWLGQCLIRDLKFPVVGALVDIWTLLIQLKPNQWCMT